MNAGLRQLPDVCDRAERHPDDAQVNHLIATVLVAADNLDPHAVADAAPPRGPH